MTKYKTGWHRVQSANGTIRKINYKPSNFREKVKNEGLFYDKKIRAWRKEEEKKKNVFRSTTTYLYTTKSGKKEEFRVYIYTRAEDVTSGELDRAMEAFFENNGFYVDWSRVRGDELNAEVDDTPPQYDVFYCTFSRAGKVLLREQIGRDEL